MNHYLTKNPKVVQWFYGITYLRIQAITKKTAAFTAVFRFVFVLTLLGKHGKHPHSFLYISHEFSKQVCRCDVICLFCSLRCFPVGLG